MLSDTYYFQNYACIIRPTLHSARIWVLDNMNDAGRFGMSNSFEV